MTPQLETRIMWLRTTRLEIRTYCLLQPRAARALPLSYTSVRQAKTEVTLEPWAETTTGLLSSAFTTFIAARLRAKQFLSWTSEPSPTIQPGVSRGTWDD